MQLIFSNPAAWWALLLIPALVLIHSLHVNRQPRIISTLFLVQSIATQRRGGRRFVFWRHSVTFWLQVLAALLLTWLLLQPRWIGQHTTQRIALVIDSSLSMSAYRDAMLVAVRSQTQSLAATAARTDWLLMESDPRAPVLYRGTEHTALLQALAAWQPGLGFHDAAPSLGMARALLGADGVVLFVTDHPPAEAPHQAATLGIGKPLDNTGFAGVRVEKRDGDTLWHTLLRNYSDQPASLQWWIEIEGERTAPRTANLPPDGSLALSGTFPKETDTITLVLENDIWPTDNRLPLIRPVAKPIRFKIDAGGQSATMRSLLASVADSGETGDTTAAADLFITELPPQPLPVLPADDAPASAPESNSAASPPANNTASPPINDAAAVTPENTTTATGGHSAATPDNSSGAGAVVNTPLAQVNNTTASPPADHGAASGMSRILIAPHTDRNTTANLPDGQLVATAHPLNDGLNWGSLILHGNIRPHRPAAGEEVLLWLGNAPLILLRERDAAYDLVFNFSPQEGNALKLPATVLLINRFAQLLRQEKAAYQAANVELGEQLRISLPQGAIAIRINDEAAPSLSPLILQAPALPGLIEVTADNTPLFRAAAHFADVREADLRRAASRSDDLDAVRSKLIEANSETDAFQPWWLLLLAAVLLASWHYAERGR